MKIIILGAGRVGSSLAETLVLENHDVTLVDTQSDKLNELSERLDIGTVTGHCSYPDVLRAAGAEAADMVIALTDSDEVNMISCQVAYSLFNIPKKIARVRSQHYFRHQELFNKNHLPIDVFISPERIVTDSIAESITCLEAHQTCSFGNGELKLIIIKAYYGGSAIGCRVQDIFTEDQSERVVAIFRRGERLEIDDETKLDVADIVYFIARKEAVEDAVRQFKKPLGPCKRIMIAGGGNLGGSLAKKLQDTYRVKVIDHNRRTCAKLAEQLERVTILCAEASDEELLVNEHIENTDLFISLTNDDEANILSAIQAKRLGAKTLMALINRSAYIHLIEGGTIQHIISPQYETMGSILAHIRQGDVVQVNCLMRGKAEAIELVAHGDEHSSEVIGRTVAAVKWPKDVILFALKRDDEFFIPNESTIIESGDHLLLAIFDKQSISLLEKLLQVSAHFF